MITPNTEGDKTNPATRWFADRDNDGFGNSKEYIENCTAPANSTNPVFSYTLNNEDCNDDPTQGGDQINP